MFIILLSVNSWKWSCRSGFSPSYICKSWFVPLCVGVCEAVAKEEFYLIFLTLSCTHMTDCTTSNSLGTTCVTCCKALPIQKLCYQMLPLTNVYKVAFCKHLASSHSFGKIKSFFTSLSQYSLPSSKWGLHGCNLWEKWELCLCSNTKKCKLDFIAYSIPPSTEKRHYL